MGFRVTLLSDPIDMNKQLNLSSTASRYARLSTLACAIALAAGGVANAFELGHSRVVSAPGQPLVVEVPINALPAEQAQSLSVNVAGAADWQAAGLTPPVALDSLSLTVKPGRNADARLVEIRSNLPTEATVVDMLLAVRTDAASRTLQTSVIVPPPPQVRLAGQQITVQRGDTLSGIANQFPVQGANLYQQLWALYSANPRAFINENMNLLRAGASLTIPDADTVRAVDPVFARAQYLEHVRAFRQMRGGGQGNQGVQAQAATQAAPSAPEIQQGAVEQSDQQASAGAVSDQVRLTAAETDQQTSDTQARVEEISRTEALERNIDALQGALAQAESATQAAGQEAAQRVERAGEAASQAVDAAGTASEQAAGAARSATDGVIEQAGQALEAAQSGAQALADKAEQDGATASEAAASAGEAALDQAQQDLGAAQSGAQSVADKAEQAAGAARSATDGAVGQVGQGLDAAQSGAQALADKAEQAGSAASEAAASAGEGALSQAQQALDTTERATQELATDTRQTAEKLASDTAAGANNVSQNAFERLSQWISDNSTAAILSLLALIALIIAWVLRKGRAGAPEAQKVTDQANIAADSFKDKLKDIDLSLDQKPDSKG